MAEYFEAKVKFLKQQDNGLIKAVTEQYLVDALSFTEVEARVQQEVQEGSREVTLVSVARSNIREVVMYGDCDLWFKVKVTYSAQDEDSEKEKKTTLYLLVNAADVPEAEARTREHLKDMLVPFVVRKVEESPICEVYRHTDGLRASLRKLVVKPGEETGAKLVIEQVLTEDEEEGGGTLSVTIKSGKEEIQVSFCDGESEDNTIHRNFNDVFQITDMLKLAHEAGRRGESIEVIEREEKDDGEEEE